MHIDAASALTGTICFNHQQQTTLSQVIFGIAGGYEPTILCHVGSGEVFAESATGRGVNLVVKLLPEQVAACIDLSDPGHQPAALLQLVLSIASQKESAVGCLLHRVDNDA